MKKVPLDYFTHHRFPGHLRTNTAGRPACIVRSANMEENTYNADIWILGQKEFVPLTSCGTVGSFWWLDDNTILFTALRNEQDKKARREVSPLTVFYTISTSSAGEAREYLRLNTNVEDILFLPDQKLLICAYYDAQAEAVLCRDKNEELAIQALAEERDYSVFTELPFWSNGEGTTSGKRLRLYLYDNGKLSPVTDETTNVQCLQQGTDPRFAYFTAVSYTTVSPLYNDLYELDSQTLQMRNLSQEGSWEYRDIIPVDHKTLVVTASDGAETGLNQNPDFFRVDIAAAQWKPLYIRKEYDVENVVNTDLTLGTSPKSCALNGHALWIGTKGSSSHLMCIHAANGEIHQLSRQKGAVCEFAPANTGIYIAALRGLKGEEIYHLSADGTETPVSAFNTKLADEYELSPLRELSFINREGHSVTGWLMEPVGRLEGQKYPAILNIHGGPKTVYGTVLFHEMQYWASLGYAVFFCNPTGSAGGGDAFGDIRGRYGDIDYDDIMRFTDIVLQQNAWIDSHRVGVTGGSYGGFMTNWIIGHTHRFAAAASQRSISNWLSMAGTSDIGYLFAPDQTAGDIWQSPQKMWQQSPLCHANKVKTPTLFIHSDEDYRCYTVEAMQMYSALQLHGVPTRLCLFHGENHNLSRSGKPRHRLRRLREITDWFAKYLA